MNDKDQLYSCEPWPENWQLDSFFFFYSYSGGGLRWFACFSSFSPPIVSNSGGGLWWFEVVCGGLWWFVVVCGGL